jgi:hypothetical protein
MGISLKDHLCEICIYNLMSENELIADFYIHVSLLYLTGKMPLIEKQGIAHKRMSLISRLENLGYFTSTEISPDLVICRPTGIEVVNGEATICAKRKEHDQINYAL